MKFGCDDNLGLPEGFAEQVGVEIVMEHELDTLVNAFVKNELPVMLIPVGTLPYIKADYDIIAQTTFGPQNIKTLTSIFIVPKNSPVNSIESVASLKLGRVNQFCTTSFWAPMIALLDQTQPGTHLDFHNTKGFPDLLSAVNDGRVEGAMLWDIILKQHSEAASHTMEVFRLDTLPAPIIIANKTVSESDKKQLREKILAYKTSQSKAFFTHFETPDHQAILNFQQKMQTCIAHFTY